MGRVLEGVGPAEEVGDQVEGHNLEEVDLEAGVPVVAGQTAQGREQVEEAYRHDLEAQPGEVEDPGLEVEVLEVLGDLVDQVGGVEDPACHQEGVVEDPQALQDQGSDLLQGQVVRGTCLSLGCPWGNRHGVQNQEDQPFLPQTSGLSEYFCVTAFQTG